MASWLIYTKRACLPFFSPLFALMTHAWSYSECQTSAIVGAGMTFRRLCFCHMAVILTELTQNCGAHQWKKKQKKTRTYKM